MTIRSSRSFRIAAVTLAFSGAALFGTAATAGAASTGCGEFSFGFEGTRLLNDGISNTAGPYPIDLPAGTYTVTAESFDDHAAHPGQLDQTAEQWIIVLDSGYVSPATSDVPEDGNWVTDTFTDQTIDASTSITLRHLGEGGVNSVSPMCVGFTTVAPAPIAEPDAPIEPPVVDPVPTTEVPLELPLVVVEEPQIAGPLAPVEIAGPVAPEAPQETVVEPTPIAVEVKPQVEVAQPAEQLALTGPSAMTWAMISVALACFAAGTALLVEERRRLS